VPEDAPDAGVDAHVDAPRCGDGILTSGEQCDDGNTASGDGCSATCVLERRCGNGIVDPGETCDDGNLTCGTCSAGCQVFASARATGRIVVVWGAISEGETFTLGDGINPPRTFEFSRDYSVTPPNTLVLISNFASAIEVRNRMVGVINDSGLWLVTDYDGDYDDMAALSVTHTRFTSVGNIPMSETVADPRFRVTGMAGGAGGDCASGQSCRSNSDCLSNTCSLNLCQ
jgi:cysteine-rich repeat protein